MPQVIKKLLDKGSLISKILLGVYTILLFVATLLPVNVISSGEKGWISKISFENGDKVVHAALFFIFTFLFFYSNLFRSYRNLILVPLFIGVSIEILQPLLKGGRTFDWFDILANLFGIILAYLFIKKIIIRIKT